MLANLTINIIISISVIVNSVYYIRYNEYGPISRFLRHMILYIAIYNVFKILPTILSLIAEMSNDKECIKGANVIVNVLMYPSNLIFFLTRLCEPHIREYLKRNMRFMVMRLKAWNYRRNEEDRTSILTNGTLLASELFDEMKMKKLEQIFLAVSICYFKSPSSVTPSPSYLETSKSKRQDDIYDYKFISQNDLNILNDASIFEKCNI